MNDRPSWLKCLGCGQTVWSNDDHECPSFPTSGLPRDYPVDLLATDEGHAAPLTTSPSDIQTLRDALRTLYLESPVSWETDRAFKTLEKAIQALATARRGEHYE